MTTALEESIGTFRDLDEARGLWGRVKRGFRKAAAFIKRDWKQTGRLSSVKRRGAGCKQGEKMVFGKCRPKKQAAPAPVAKKKKAPPTKKKAKAPPPQAKKPVAKKSGKKGKQPAKVIKMPARRGLKTVGKKNKATA